MEEVEELKKQLNALTEKVESLKSTPDDRIMHLERAVESLKDKYIKLLEEKIEQKKSEVPMSHSNITTQRPAEEPTRLDRLQLLILLKESRAVNREFAVTANQFIKAFSINRTSKTLRNKLNELEFLGYVNSIGQKPKAFFLTPKGISMIQKEQKMAMEVGPRNAEF